MFIYIYMPILNPPSAAFLPLLHARPGAAPDPCPLRAPPAPGPFSWPTHRPPSLPALLEGSSSAGLPHRGPQISPKPHKPPHYLQRTLPSLCGLPLNPNKSTESSPPPMKPHRGPLTPITPITPMGSHPPRPAHHTGLHRASKASLCTLKEEPILQPRTPPQGSSCPQNPPQKHSPFPEFPHPPGAPQSAPAPPGPHHGSKAPPENATALQETPIPRPLWSYSPPPHQAPIGLSPLEPSYMAPTPNNPTVGLPNNSAMGLLTPPKTFLQGTLLSPLKPHRRVLHSAPH